MKKTKFHIIIFSLIAIAMSTACKKAELIKFEDRSTATRADKSGWTATADSETPDGWENTGKASAVLDGSFDTYWHTDYSVVVPYPHWVLIDMKTETNLIAVDITNRQRASSPNTVGMKKFKIEGSNDGNTFANLGEFEFAITNSAQSFPVSSANAYRYLKVTALEPQVEGTNHTFLAEIDVFVAKSK